MSASLASLLVAVVALLLLLPFGHTSTDVAVAWISVPTVYNPSLVEHGDKYVAALKRTTFRKARGKTFWVNHLYMCTGEKKSLNALTCDTFNPWRQPYNECEFDSRVRDGKTDVTGLGDVKMWEWPGKGVYAIFGRKPQVAPGAGRYCTTQVVYDQWIAQVVSDPGAGQWRLEQPLRLRLDSTYPYPKDAPYIMEKNWMPWVHRVPNGSEALFVTHSVNPHRVLAVSPSGVCSVAHETPGDPRLFARLARYDIHGGPPVVYVPGSLSRDGAPYYLGIMHHIELLGGGGGGGGGGSGGGFTAANRGLRQQAALGGGGGGSRATRRTKKVKLYRHFAYKFSPEPPFAITAVSDELPLTFYRHESHPSKAYIAYVAGLYMSANGTLLISYGAGDREARVLVMSLAELEAGFTGRVAFLQHAAAGRGLR